MTETLANGYSSESTQRELSNEYQHDRVQMISLHSKICIRVLWTNVYSALEGLSDVFYLFLTKIGLGKVLSFGTNFFGLLPYWTSL